MAANVREHGRYELFKSNHGHRILVLNDRDWYAWVHGQEGEILVHSDRSHQKESTLQHGRFYYVEFHDDPKFKDMPHLFLEQESHYEELMVPDGLPTERDHQKKVIKTNDTIGKDELERYLQHPEPAGKGEERMGRPGGGSMANVTHHLEGVHFPARRNDLIDYARHEKHAPHDVMSQLEKLPDREYHTMAEVTSAISQGKEAAGETLPIKNYDRLDLDEIKQKIQRLGDDDLRKIRQYEEQHKNRVTVKEAIDSKLNLPIGNYASLTVAEMKRMLDDLNAEQIRTLKHYEQKHLKRKSAMEALDRALEEKR